MHGILLILHLVLLVCVAEVVLCKMQLKPRNVTVLQGAEVHFNCSTDELWEVMVWQLNGRSVLTISAMHGPLGYDESIWAVNHSSSAASVWEFVLKSSTFSPTVQEVICELLPGNVHRQSAALSVQEKGSVMILGGNVSVQVRAQVALQCHAVGWYPDPAVGWSVNGAAVNSSKFNSSSVQDYAGLFNVTSVLWLRVEESSRVDCLVSVSALPAPHTWSVFVSAVPPGNDSILVIVVSVTMCVIALLIFIAVLFFCRRTRMESEKYREEVSIGQQDSEKNPEEKEGQINLGYHSEVPTGFSHPHHGVTVTSAGMVKVPDIIYIMSHEPRPDDSGQKRYGVKKTRQTTTV